MKKVLCLTMLMVFLLSSMIFAVACGGDNDGSAPQPTPAPTPSPEPQPPTEPNTVMISSAGFNPAVITIKVGEKVTWHNQDTRRWWVSSQNKTPDTGVIPVGARMSYTFKEAGEYDYYDLYHRDETGKVIVE